MSGEIHTNREKLVIKIDILPKSGIAKGCPTNKHFTLYCKYKHIPKLYHF